jgi:transposase
MTSRNDLDLEQKVKLIKDKENGMSVRELKDKLNVSIGSVSNILKRKTNIWMIINVTRIKRRNEKQTTLYEYFQRV